MSYIKNSLLPVEKIIFIEKPHRVIFAAPIMLLVASMLLMLWGRHIIPVSLQFYLPFFEQLRFDQFIGYFVFIIAAYQLLVTVAFYYNSEYGVTNRRVIIKRGFLTQQALELFLRRIEAVYVSQSLFGRIYNYGTLVIVGTGGTRDAFTNVPNPAAFRRKIQQQVEKAIRRTSDDD